jgi:HEAT repeat protein
MDVCRQSPLFSHLLRLAAPVLTIGVALVVSTSGGSGAVWGKLSEQSAKQKSLEASIALPADLDREEPQKQAEVLLERAVVHSEGATGQIETRMDAWRGKLQWDSQLGQLTTAALNSKDRAVQDCAMEVQLTAYGLSKSDSTVDALIQQANSRNHAKKIWALWGLALLGNRGIGTDRIVQTLSAHLKDGDHFKDRFSEDTRRWAVDGLALVGTNSTITPLLEAMHNDPSPAIRQRAAVSVAESNMLTHEQRLIAVPRLIDYSADPELDAQTHTLAFQALSDITGQRLPNDSTAWRDWYHTFGSNN